MSFVKLAWVTSCLGFLLTLSHHLLESSLTLANPPLASDALSLNERSRVLLPSRATAPVNSRPVTVQAPLQLGFVAREMQDDTLANSGLASLSAQAAAWQHSLGNAFCRSTPPFLVNWQEVPPTPAVATKQSAFATLSWTQRFAQAVESMFHWSNLASGRDRQSLDVSVTTSPLAATRPTANAVLNFWTVLRQPNLIFETATPTDPTEFYVTVNDRIVGRLTDERQAELIAERLESLLSDPDFDPDSLQPSLVGGRPAGQAGERLLFVIDESISPSRDQNRELMAIKWVNNLRLAFALEPLDLVVAQQEMYGILETRDEFQGVASWYGPYFHGRLTANGETYDQEAFTAAHPSLPFNTYLKVTNLETDTTAIVRINDRGPYIPPRTLDLSRGAARCLNSKDAGVVPYRAVIMEPYAAIADDRADNNI